MVRGSRRDDAPALAGAREGRRRQARPASRAERALIRGIAGELREALLNLVQNALDAMARRRHAAHRTVLSSTEASVAVSDTGTGMSAEVRERAFEPFFTTKGVNGTGLGLAEVYGIARRHRGRAEIESAPGEGTTVRLVFPPAARALETPSVPMRAIRAPQARAPRGGSRRQPRVHAVAARERRAHRRVGAHSRGRRGRGSPISPRRSTCSSPTSASPTAAAGTSSRTAESVARH